MKLVTTILSALILLSFSAPAIEVGTYVVSISEKRDDDRITALPGLLLVVSKKDEEFQIEAQQMGYSCRCELQLDAGQTGDNQWEALNIVVVMTPLEESRGARMVLLSGYHEKRSGGYSGSAMIGAVADGSVQGFFSMQRVSSQAGLGEAGKGSASPASEGGH